MKRHIFDARRPFACGLSKTPPHVPKHAGFTLIELMIAMVLGLLIVAGAVSLLLSNKRTYVANSSLGQVQDNSRTAFELMARDIRQTGLTGCGNPGRIANVLSNGPNAGATDLWYADMANAVVGFDGNTADPAVTTATSSASATAGQRVSGTSSIELVGSDGVGVTINTHTPSASTTTGTITINESSTTLLAGDLAVVCDPDHAAILQLASVGAGPPIIFGYNTTSGSPGNCSLGLGFPTACTGTANAYTYATNSQLAKLYAADWYVGYNNVGGTSLYRMALVNTGGIPTSTAQEMVRNVSAMQITYNVPNSANATTFVTAANVGAGNWGSVAAVQINITLLSSNKYVSSSTTAISRQLSTTVSLRNRL